MLNSNLGFGFQELVFRLLDPACVKLQAVVPVKGLNVEHRTSNIEHRMMMTLRFVDFIKPAIK